jgi:uncharacterized protein YndB with AHSA1/START domain
MRFTNTITIDRPPAAVFAYLADFENVPQWNYAIQQTRKLTDGPVAVGSRYQQRRTLPDPAEETFEVTEYEPDHTLAVRGTLGPFPAQASYTLEAAGDATVLTNTFDLEPQGALKLVAPIATRRIKSAVAANLDVLKQILERA